MTAPKPFATFLHLSDLHFGGSLQNKGKGPLAFLGAARHDFNLLVDLQTCVNLYTREKGVEIDLVLATGDVTTSASRIAFEEVNNFLRWSKYVSPRVRIGLEMRERVLIVPGNHDTWFTRLLLPVSREHECRKYLYFKSFPHLRQFEFGGRRFSFCLLDSNQTGRWLKNISRGRVGGDQLNEVALWIANLKGEQRQFFDNSIRIAMLHHHVYLPKDVKEDKATKMLDAQGVLEFLVRENFQMVIFGHKHISFHDFYPKEQALRKIVISAAGTATQADQSENSFKVYTFWSEKIEVVEFVHGDQGFQANPAIPFSC